MITEYTNRDAMERHNIWLSSQAKPKKKRRFWDIEGRISDRVKDAGLHEYRITDRMNGLSDTIKRHERNIELLRASERETVSNLRELLQYLGLEIVDVEQERHREVRKIEKEES